MEQWLKLENTSKFALKSQCKEFSYYFINAIQDESAHKWDEWKYFRQDNTFYANAAVSNSCWKRQMFPKMIRESKSFLVLM